MFLFIRSSGIKCDLNTRKPPNSLRQRPTDTQSAQQSTKPIFWCSLCVQSKRNTTRPDLKAKCQDVRGGSWTVPRFKHGTPSSEKSLRVELPVQISVGTRHAAQSNFEPRGVYICCAKLYVIYTYIYIYIYVCVCVCFVV